MSKQSITFIHIIPPLTSSSFASSIIWIHGLGDNGTGWKTTWEHLQRQYSEVLGNTRIVLPIAAQRRITKFNGRAMSGWFDPMISEDKTDPNQDEQGIRESCYSITNLIEQEHDQHGVPYERIFVGGFSQGGCIAMYSVLTLVQHRIGGVIALSSFLPLFQSFSNDMRQENANTPILVAHGTNDPVIQFHYGKLASETIAQVRAQKYGQSDKNVVQFKAYQGMAHTTNMEELASVVHFMKNVLQGQQSQVEKNEL